MKKTWQLINTVRGKTKRTIKPSFTIDSTKVTNRRLIANAFNKRYVELAPNLNKAYTDDLGSVARERGQPRYFQSPIMTSII